MASTGLLRAAVRSSLGAVRSSPDPAAPLGALSWLLQPGACSGALTAAPECAPLRRDGAHGYAISAEQSWSPCSATSTQGPQQQRRLHQAHPAQGHVCATPPPLQQRQCRDSPSRMGLMQLRSAMHSITHPAHRTSLSRSKSSSLQSMHQTRMRALSTSSPALSRGGHGHGHGDGPAGGAAGGADDGMMRMSLGDALNKLVDAAVEKVEAGDLADAVSILKEGLIAFEPKFPNSPEIGELHNQVSLLLLFQNRAEEAATHAQAALDSAKLHFGASNVLTGHRMLRLGVARFGQSKMSDAAGLLRQALDVLGPVDPGSKAEAAFYLDLVALAHVRDTVGIKAVEEALLGNVREIKAYYGAESMLMSLAVSCHSRLVHGALDSSLDVSVGEAMLKQHLALLAEVDPDGEEAAVTRYKLATYYYTHDLLHDAGAQVRQAATAMRERGYSEDHDMIVLCKHRLGMVCAASGDHRAAKQLLSLSRDHYSKEGPGHMLSREAEIGLAMARFRAVDPREPRDKRSEERQQALDDMRQHIDALAQAVGHGHMLVQGATRYYGHLIKLLDR